MFRHDALAKGRYPRVPSRWDAESGRWVADFGVPRIVAGAPGHTNCSGGQVEETGRVFLYEYDETNAEFDEVAELVNSNVVVEQLGWRVAVGGDIDGGDAQDIVVGTLGAPVFTTDLYVRIYEGGVSAGTLSPSSTIKYTSPPNDSNFGRGVYGGDLDDDAYADVIVSDITADRSGEYDPMVRLDRWEACRDLLLPSSYEVEWRSYPMEHQVYPLEIQHIGQWMGRVVSVD
jgi:hypothetical protein